jgi:uncharacterized membrane protein
VHSPTEDKDEVTKEFYEEIERVLDQFLKYHLKIVVGGLNESRGKRFSNQKSGVTVLMKLIMIIGLE